MSRQTHLPDLAFHHLDVFTDRPLAGNGVVVFPNATGVDGETMLRLAQEMRQFESIFLLPDEVPGQVHARIFTTEEELAFAGHPVLAAATVLHELAGGDSMTSTVHLSGRPVDVSTRRDTSSYSATMDQGCPSFGRPLAEPQTAEVLDALGLGPEDLARGLPVQVVSTGLPYLMIPIRSGIERVQIDHPDFGALLGSMDAKFSYPFDVERVEGRSFDNDGLVEDVATGSAAGPAGAYLVAHELAEPDGPIVVHQGRFVGRPSRMTVRVHRGGDAIDNVTVGGDVVYVATGRLATGDGRVPGPVGEPESVS